MTNINKPIKTIYGNHFDLYEELWKKQIDDFKKKFGEKLILVKFPKKHFIDVPILYIDKTILVEVMNFVKKEKGFEYNFLSDLTASDEKDDPRFRVIYNLFSHSNFSRIRFKLRIKENESVPSLVNVWKGANWAEREVYDMFGIKFDNHPDLRRILMDERWKGYPLLKDYPLRGYQIFPEPEHINPDLLKD